MPRSRARLRSKKLIAWRSKWSRRLLRGALVAMVVLVALGARLFAFPASDDIAVADAAVVFAGGGESALQEALTLANSGHARALVVVGGSGGLCDGRGTMEVLCPAAGTTDIEQVRVLAELAAARGWASMALVTPRHSLSRTAMVVNRCTDAVVLRRAAPTPAGGALLRAALGEFPRYLAELASPSACTT